MIKLECGDIIKMKNWNRQKRIKKNRVLNMIR